MPQNPPTDIRPWVVTLKGGETKLSSAPNRGTASYNIAKEIMDRHPGMDMKEAMSFIKHVRVAPGFSLPRGPKPGTPNAFYQRNPQFLSQKRQLAIKAQQGSLSNPKASAAYFARALERIALTDVTNSEDRANIAGAIAFLRRMAKEGG